MTRLRIEGGHILTPDYTIERADVLIDQGEGSIEQIGTGIPPGDDAISADGCLVIPGLINAHTHIPMTLLRGYADDKRVEDWLEEDIWPVEAALTPEDIRAGTALGVLEMIESGTTGFFDMYFMVEEIADVVASAGLRARLGYGMITAGKGADAANAEIAQGLEVAESLMNNGNDRIHGALTPHSLTTVDLDLLEPILADAREAGIPVQYHANESRQFVDPIVEDTGKLPLAVADDYGLLEAGDSLAHCVHVEQTEIAVMAESGAAVVHCPASNMKLASGIAPVQAMLDAGVTVGIGTDGAASNNTLDMLRELGLAALLGKLGGDDARAVAAEAAVSMATEGSAAAAGLPGGKIVEGGVADLAVIDLAAPKLTPQHDPISHLAYVASGSDVRHTIVDGQVLLRDRACLTLNRDTVLEEASQRASELVERAAE